VCAARPGHVLLDVDWKGIEASVSWLVLLMTPTHALGRLGVHDYFCYHLLAYRGKLKTSDIHPLTVRHRTQVRIQVGKETSSLGP